MKKIILFIFSLLLFVACDDPNEDNMAPAVAGSPISTWLDENPENYSQWANLLRHTNLYNTMNLGATYTSFVPNNEAMATYLKDNNYASVEAIPVDYAKLLVKYHTIKGKAYKEVDFVNGVIPDTTATGDYLSIEYRDNDLIYVNGAANISQRDVSVTNGVLHGISSVLLPITASVWDKVNTANSSIFAEAIKMTGYDEMLSKIREGSQAFHFTLMSVPNTVYTENSISNVAGLISVLGAGTDYTDPENALNKYVAYHIFDQQIDMNEFSSFPDDATSKNIAPIVKGELINVSTLNNLVYLNYDKVSEKGITITNPNINAKNGIVHEVNAPMYLFTPDAARVIWEVTDYSELSKVLDNYRKSVSSSVGEYIEFEDNVECYKWETATLNNRNSAVRYWVYQVNDPERYKMQNHDALGLRLRVFGWLTMETPTIIAGKYKINIRHYSPSKTARDGYIKLTLDDEYLNENNTVSLNGHSTTASTNRTTALSGTVEFNSTSTHTLRIIQTDDVEIFIDYIEFVPVD